MAEGTSFLATGKMLFSLLPSIMIITFPMAVLLAGLLVYGRLASENELTALHACGYSVNQLLIPILVIGIGLTGMMFWWGHRIAPKGLRIFRTVAADILKTTATTGIQPGGFNQFGDFIFLPSAIDSNQLKNLKLFEIREDSIAGVISAPTATITFSPEESILYLDLEEGVLHQIPAPERDVAIRFSNMHFSILIPTLLKNFIRTGNERRRYGNEQLREETQSYHQAYLQIEEENAQKRFYFREWKQGEVEQASRIALPFACLIMAVTGALLGMGSHFGKRSSCYAMTIFVIFSYYVLLNFGETYAEDGILPTHFAIWIPNIVGILSSVYLLIRTMRV